jgi:adenylate cyclase
LDDFDEFQSLLVRTGLFERPFRRQQLVQTMQSVRRTVAEDPAARAKLQRLLDSNAASIEVATRQRLTTLARLYGGADAQFVNFYGPPGQICTVPYDLLFHDKSRVPCLIRGSAVFVGVGASRIERADQQDTYHTVFDRGDGTDLSGVEIHATAFANLLTGHTLEPIPPTGYLLVVVLFGLCAGVASYLIRSRGRWHERVAPRVQAAMAAITIGVAYSAVSYLFFASFDVILPLAIPLLFQLPVALIGALATAPAKHKGEAWAICLITDVENSTEIGQRLGHARFSQLLFEYEKQICRRVTRRRGVPLGSQGDGLLCVWLRPLVTRRHDDARLRLQICLAALEISRSELKTRIGADIGQVTVEADADRGPANIKGDPATVAARLQDQARYFPSRVLVTKAVVEGLGDKLCLRRHVLKLDGIGDPVESFEIVGPAASASETSRTTSAGAA